MSDATTAHRADLHVKLWEYPDGSRDGHAMWRSTLPDAPPPSLPAREWRSEAERGVQDDATCAANRTRSARRSRKSLMRMIRMGSMDTLGTLTIGGDNVPGQYQATSLALDWFRRYGRRLMDDRAAVFVPEYGECNGRVHVHFAIRKGGSRWDYSAIIASWSEYLTRRGYHSSVGTHRVHLSVRRTSRTLARYLGKYLGKSLDGVELPKGSHRYRAVGCSAPSPAWVVSVEDVATLRDVFGIRPEQLYAYEIPDVVTGELFTVGYGFDTGG